AFAGLYIVARQNSRYDPLDPRFGSCIPPIQGRKTPAEWAPSLSDTSCPETVRHLIEPAHERRRDRNAVAPARFARGVAALAGNGDPVHAGHPLGVSDIAHQGVDARLEGDDVAEGRDVDRRDRLTG